MNERTISSAERVMIDKCGATSNSAGPGIDEEYYPPLSRAFSCVVLDVEPRRRTANNSFA